MLQFSKEFFEREKREGFIVEPLMKSAWAAQIKVLYQVDTICKENNIPYFADGGTLLGAIRHNGYIPWDDDIDICILRDDYDRFCELVKETENLTISNIHNISDWGECAERVQEKEVFKFDRRKIKDNFGYPFAAGIDLFVMEHVPRKKSEEKAWCMMIGWISCLVQLRKKLKYDELKKEERDELLKEEKNIFALIKEMIGMEDIGPDMSDQEFIILKDRISSLYKKDDGYYLTEIFYLASGRDFYLPVDFFNSSIRVPFENICISAPKDYDMFLKLEYGDDYMIPKQGTAAHDYPFYKGIIKGLAELKGMDEGDIWQYIDKIGPKYWEKFLNKESKPTLSVSESFFDTDNINLEHKQNWMAMLEVYAEIKRLCVENDIKIFAVGDTLSHVVEKNEMIPTTEEFHLAIHRKDFEQLCNILQEELDPWFDFRSIYTHQDHDDLRIYVLTDGYLCDEEEYKERFHGCTNIVGVDIAVLDMVDPNMQKDALRVELGRGLMKTSKLISKEPPYSEVELAIVDEWKNITGAPINNKNNLKQEFIKNADILHSLYKKESGKVRMNTCLSKDDDTVYNKEWFADVIEKEFASVPVWIPVGYKEVLNKDYNIG